MIDSLWLRATRRSRDGRSCLQRRDEEDGGREWGWRRWMQQHRTSWGPSWIGVVWVEWGGIVSGGGEFVARASAPGARATGQRRAAWLLAVGHSPWRSSSVVVLLLLLPPWLESDVWTACCACHPRPALWTTIGVTSGYCLNPSSILWHPG